MVHRHVGGAPAARVWPRSAQGPGRLARCRGHLCTTGCGRRRPAGQFSLPTKFAFCPQNAFLPRPPHSLPTNSLRARSLLRNVCNFSDTIPTFPWPRHVPALYAAALVSGVKKLAEGGERRGGQASKRASERERERERQSEREKDRDRDRDRDGRSRTHAGGPAGPRVGAGWLRRPPRRPASTPARLSPQPRSRRGSPQSLDRRPRLHRRPCLSSHPRANVPSSWRTRKRARPDLSRRISRNETLPSIEGISWET